MNKSRSMLHTHMMLHSVLQANSSWNVWDNLDKEICLTLISVLHTYLSVDSQWEL